MVYLQGDNRRKRWYSMLSIGQKKIICLLVLVAGILLGIVGVVSVYSYRAMQYDLQRVVAHSGAGVLYDAEHRVISSLSLGGSSEQPLTWAEVPQNLINAFVAREDETYFEHRGVVLSSIIRSVLRNMSSMRYEQGASTITMQLTRNVYELRDKSLDRKMLEVMLAQRIERHYDKQTIMLQYLSRIYYGQSCYGIREAARRYFGKQVSELSLSECAMLAGVVRAPSLFNPVTSMKSAMEVKKETLLRMLECGMISEVECNAAIAEPIKLTKVRSAASESSSYAAMWTYQELQELQADMEDNSGGLSVVSSLNLNLQQYMEQAVEKALSAVERAGAYPERWYEVDKEAGYDADGRRVSFVKMRRPKELKARGADNDLKGLLQCCALVVDTRNSMRGNVLAVVSGRSAVDGKDRWQSKVMPGRVAAPLVFGCACLPGADDLHIVARSAEITGKSMGYDVVRSFIDTLKLDIKLPEREKETDLYNGLFYVRKLDLARVLFSLQNQGRGYPLNLVNSIWSQTHKMLYRYEAEKAPEYIRRESAVSVATLPPFNAPEGAPVTMNETLPGHTGQMAMVYRNRAACVFVWMGFDDTSSEVAQAREMRPLLTRAAMNLARELFAQTRAEMRAEQQKPKQETPAAA